MTRRRNNDAAQKRNDIGKGCGYDTALERVPPRDVAMVAAAFVFIAFQRFNADDRKVGAGDDVQQRCDAYHTDQKQREKAYVQ